MLFAAAQLSTAFEPRIDCEQKGVWNWDGASFVGGHVCMFCDTPKVDDYGLGLAQVRVADRLRRSARLNTLTVVAYMAPAERFP